MECREVERCGELSLDGETEPAEQAELELHLGACPQCRATFSSKGWYLSNVRAKLAESNTATSPTHGLRSAVLLKIRQESEAKPVSFGVVVPATVIASVLIVVSWAQKTTPPLDPEPAVAFHTRNLPPEVSGRRDLHAVERFVRRNVRHPFRFPEPDPERSQIRLVGARLSHMDNREAVQFIYDQRGARISLFAHPAPATFSPPPGFKVLPVKGGSLLVGHHRGYSVVSWYGPKKDVLYSLVSDVDDQELVRLASSFDKMTAGAGDLTEN